MGRESIPADKQYWTLAGMHTNDGCELPQALSEGIIQSPSQFHGVDREADVIRNNREAYPGANWYQGEFTSVLDGADPFNPGLINFDMVCVVDNAGLGVAQALHILVDRGVDDALLVANFLLNNPRENSWRCRSPTDIWEWFYRSACRGNTIRRAIKRGWRVHTETYLYDGADEASNSYMQTIYFFKGGRQTGIMHETSGGLP
jgi:hypothetical protein